jgi:hypothetical protein
MPDNHSSQSKSPPSSGKDSLAQQNRIKSMKIDMNLQFTKEVTIKKDIYELEMKNEDLAFKLFSKQLTVTKNRNKGLSILQIE